MPRNGVGIYQPPAGSIAVPNTTIGSAAYNNALADIAATLNEARPINMGGTGATTAAGALVNLGLTATAAELNALDGVTATGTALVRSADPDAARTSLGLGTAATRDTGSTENTIPVLGAGGLIDLARIPVASQDEAEAGTDATKLMTPQRVRNAFNATGSAPVYACRAWVNFNGTGTVAIRASGNVSSITDLATGTYTINFMTNMPDTNYCVQTTSGNNGASGPITGLITAGTVPNTSAINVLSANDIGVRIDQEYYHVAVFR